MHPTSKKSSFVVIAIAALLSCTLEMPGQQPAAGAGGAPANTSQSDPEGGQAREQRRNVFVYLGLSPEQKREWIRIQRETTQNVRAARIDDSLSEEQMQQKLREIHAEQRRQIIALLTPQQQESLKQWWEEQKQQKEKEKGSDAPSGSSATKPSSADDDYFAGMVQDPDPAPAKGNKSSPPKN